MNTLQQDFYGLRCAGTPWCLILTPDYRECQRSLCKTLSEQDKPPSLWAWDCIQGHRCLSETNMTGYLGSPDDTVQAPALLLKKALELPANSVLFFIVPKNDMIEETAVIQGLANLRNEFKANGRTIALLGRDTKLPSFLSEDVPVLEDPLPNDGEIKGIIEGLVKKFRGLDSFDASPDRIERAADLCRGLPRFASEEAISRNLTKQGIDFVGLADIQRRIVETATDRGLVYERGRETFDDIGGQASFKQFLQGLFAGPRRPRLVVRWDEIDKSVSSSAMGAVADNTGVSQDMLKVLLTSMQDYNWMGIILVGGPGTGKTLSSVCTGNSFQVRTLVGDLGAARASLVGESERRIRSMMDIIRAVGGQDVLFLATANRLETLPPELQRRFNLGIWYFDVPSQEERAAIWKIQTKRFGLECTDLPDDTGWVGSDIRNCCQTAYMLSTSLKKAAEWITLVGRSARADIERLRDMAENLGFLSANHPGVYRRMKETNGRAIKL
ncbi:MAG: AAA family ATPase [Gemmataceae bacterium]|nr:AAA family ATPase [Gemmataceae bacterium]